MEREIKFRAKEANTNRWVFGDLIQYENGDTAIFENKMTEYGCEATQICRRTKVQFDTIGQYTGLQDKNGKDIYEGDILMCIRDRSDNKGKKYYRSVLFKHGSFCMTVPGYNCLSSLYNHVVNGKLLWEIVGNIYDNKDLLED